METQARILSTMEMMTKAFNRGDIEGIMRTYEPGAVVIGEPGVPVQGDERLRALFESFIAAKANFTFDDHEVIAAGDIALHIMPWSMTGEAPDGSPIAANGLSLAVLRRQPDGRWLMLIDDPYGDVSLRRGAQEHTPELAVR